MTTIASGRVLMVTARTAGRQDKGQPWRTPGASENRHDGGADRAPRGSSSRLSDPAIDDGRFPIKRTVGEEVVVTADIFAEGHDILARRDPAPERRR